MLLNDMQLMGIVTDTGMIDPFLARSVKEVLTKDGDVLADYPALSFGLSSCGYDVRLAPTVKAFVNVHSGIIDPKIPETQQLTDLKVHQDLTGEYVIVPPHTYILGHTVEVFDIPRDVFVLAVGKSTYARKGIILNVTPIEPGFKGTVVVELANTASLPCKVYVNEGVGQFIFFKTEPCAVSYADRSGKYQGQRGIELGKC